MKNILFVLASAFISVFGNFNDKIYTLIIFMIIDFITGLIVAGVFKKSHKTKGGKIESNVLFKGICKKTMILFMIIIGNRLDKIIGEDYIRNTIVIAFIINELFSITENAAIMNIPIPDIIKKSIERINIRD